MTATATTLAPVAIPRSEIARALRAAASIRSEAIHIDLDSDPVTITASIAEVAVRVALEAVRTDPGGAGFVNRKMLAGLLPYLAHDCRLSFSHDTLTVKSGDSTFEIRTLREDAVKGLDHDLESSGSNSVEIDAPVLVETLRRALPFASGDYTRPILRNVALYPDVNVAVSTDSYRLAIISYGDGGGTPSAEPLLLNVDGAKSLRALLAKKLGTVTLSKVDGFLAVEFEGTRWSLKREMPYTVGDKVKTYPEWWNLIPDTKPMATVKVDREDLLAAARAAGVVAHRNAPLRLRTHGLTVSVEAHSLDKAAMTRTLPSAEFIGEDVECGFNPAFLADICAVAPVERLMVKLIAPLRPAVIEAARDQYVLMPIRLNV